MRIDNEHFTEVEILSFNAKCKIDEMSYEQTVNIRTNEGTVIKLLDFMGFAVTEERLGKGKRIVLCIPYVDGEISILDSGEPGLVECNFEWESDTPSRVTVIARVLESSKEDHDLLVDAGFGKIYIIPDEDVSIFKIGDIIKLSTDRLDLIEILE